MPWHEAGSDRSHALAPARNRARCIPHAPHRVARTSPDLILLRDRLHDAGRARRRRDEAERDREHKEHCRGRRCDRESAGEIKHGCPLPRDPDADDSKGMRLQLGAGGLIDAQIRVADRRPRRASHRGARKPQRRSAHHLSLSRLTCESVCPRNSPAASREGPRPVGARGSCIFPVIYRTRGASIPVSLR